ncbi:MAG: acid phosphatase [Candidatus Komeilibacteria bacterium CG10_big_fil_rev_8_21_14_0_10_41_13]|uniref:Acid phosphatase n=1 Tax=Candidatus Komeilibacteria bacterium CG10_big_fil_rev_8_21_14_0_10_41_13 TaxID=1974476 RepID=A0A2M6WD06_9BACT|nr:MAG: acid phosphatase [Candidatus Komeilibacteria bacterium CG10_big_fil_rev_8_21_14_0_10_41_13]
MELFILPIIIALLVHAIKLAIDVVEGTFSWHTATHYGGMPSSHSALVTSLATVIYMTEGLSTAFAVSLVLAVLVIRDAIGLRNYLSQHGWILNKLIKDLPDEKEFKYPVLQEKIAHTWMEVTVGAILGVLLTCLFFYLI